jgi:chemotaxis protein histidine kinase CheA
VTPAGAPIVLAVRDAGEQVVIEVRDGGPGLRYCRLLAQYEGFTAAEIRRLRRAAP